MLYEKIQVSMSTSPISLTLAGFSAQCATSFTVSGADGIALTLSEALALHAQAPDERRFSLIFHGPAQPVLPQATYTLEHAALGTLAIFLVPVGRDAQAVHYQAIFN